MASSTQSYGRQVWLQLKKNKAAFVSLILIVFAALLSVFGYLLAPDNSPYADLQTVEIQARNPGYRQMFLKIPLQHQAEEKNLFQRIFYGSPPGFSYLPINAYTLGRDSIAVQKFVDEDTSVLQHYAISQIVKSPAEIKNNIVTKTYWLGTDAFGRDILSRIIIGTRVSLSVGLISVLISLLIGTTLGAIAGYFRGRIDDAIMWLVNVTWSIPTLLLVFAFTLAMGKGFWQIFIAVGLTMWVSVARLVRGQVLAIRELEYVQAARALGFTNSRIIIKHILPNILGPLLVIAAGNFATAIIIEAGLSFLGIGVQPPQPSWGLMIKENYNFIITHHPTLALIPGFAIMMMVLAFNLLGNGLRDAVDVKQQ